MCAHRMPEGNRGTSTSSSRRLSERISGNVLRLPGTVPVSEISILPVPETVGRIRCEELRTGERTPNPSAVRTLVEFPCSPAAEEAVWQRLSTSGIRGPGDGEGQLQRNRPEFREPALDAVARSYQQTVRELGHTQDDAEIWISAVMLRLRATLQSKKKLRSGEGCRLGR